MCGINWQQKHLVYSIMWLDSFMLLMQVKISK